MLLHGFGEFWVVGHEWAGGPDERRRGQALRRAILNWSQI
jgi:hypothetical protein